MLLNLLLRSPEDGAKYLIYMCLIHRIASQFGAARSRYYICECDSMLSYMIAP